MSVSASVWLWLRRVFWIVLAGYVVYRCVYVLGTILAAVVFAYVAIPLVDGLCKTPMGCFKTATQRAVATAIVFLLLISIAVMIISLMIVPFRQEIVDFKNNADQYMNEFKSYMSDVVSWYSDVVPKSVQDWIGKINYSGILTRLGGMSGHLLGYVGSWITFIADIIIIPVFAFYFVMDYRSMGKELYGLFPRCRWREAMRLGRRVGEITQSYVVGQLILCIIAGAFTTAFLAILGMPYVVVLGLFAGITRAIPIIGPVVSGIPIILVGLLNSDGPAIPVALLLFVTIVHFVESKFIMPRLIGHRLHLHPAVVLVVLLIGAEFFGLIGMFVAAPVAAIVRDIIRFYYIGDRGGGSRPHPVGESQ